MKSIVIATPHARYDGLERVVREQLAGWEVVRVREPGDLDVERLRALQPAWVFFPHWSWRIPEDVLDEFRCVIFHMTDLPYGRGGSPLQNLIVRGHRETRLTALRCVRELDAGPVYFKQPLSLAGSAEQILQRASGIMAGMVLQIVREEPQPVEQSGEVVPFRRRRPEDGDLAPLAELDAVYDYIRMLDADGYPPAFLAVNGLVYEFHEAQHRGEWIEARVRIRRRGPQ